MTNEPTKQATNDEAAPAQEEQLKDLAPTETSDEQVRGGAGDISITKGTDSASPKLFQS